MYLFFGVVNSASSSIVGNFLVDFLETLVLFSAILLPTKSPVASAVFCIAHLEAVFIASVADFLAVSTSFFSYLLLILLAKDMNPYPFTSFLVFGLALINISFIHYLITMVRFILSSISKGLLFSSLNHTIISSHSELNVFKKI